MAEISGSSWSETDALNSSPAPNGFPEGMPFSGVNDSARAVMGAVKRFWGRINGRYASGGAANAYTLTPDVALAAYAIGERYSFRASFANTGAATLNISSLGAKSIKKMTASGKAELDAGDIQSGQPVTVEYDGTDFVMVTPPSTLHINGLPEDTSPDISADYVATYDASAGTNKKVKPSALFAQHQNAKPCFLAHMNDVDQTNIPSITNTKLLFGTADINVGDYYDTSTSKFIPPAGRYRLTAQAFFIGGVVDQLRSTIMIYKNGSLHRQGSGVASGEQVQAQVSCIVEANGTDEFEVYVFSVGDGVKTVSGSSANTFFCGEKI